jgi:co-chaperonin GroES (HSP10)
MKIKKVIGLNVLVEYSETEVKTDSGLYLPSLDAKDSHLEAVAVKVGTRVKKVKEGDTIVVDKMAQHHVYVEDGEEYKFIHVESVIAVK